MMNPITHKELRLRMRGPRIFVILSIYLSVLGGITLLMYLAATYLAANENIAEVAVVSISAMSGRTLYWVIVSMALVVVTFLAPAFTAVSISREREHNTLGLLQASQIRGRHIVWGKFVVAFGLVGWMAAATLPLFGLCFLLGGVEPMQIFISGIILMVAGFSFCALGLCVSAHAYRSIVATIITYALVFVITLGIPIIIGLFTLWMGTRTPTPIPSLQQSISSISAYLTGLSPLGAIISTEANFLNQGRIWTIETPSTTGAAAHILPAPFFVFTCLHLVAGTLLLWLAVRRIDKTETH